MNAIELFHKDGRSAQTWYCEKCRIVRRTQAKADKCCEPPACADCGTLDVSSYSTKCRACITKADAARERARFEKATIIADAFGGPVFCEGVGYSEGFFGSLDELLDHLGCDHEGDRPAYAYPCDEASFVNADADAIYERIADDAFEDFDTNDLSGRKELEDAIAKFNEANQIHKIWNPDYSRVILIGPAETE